MVDFTFRNEIVNKLMNGERLTDGEISIIERLLTLDAYYEDTLDVKVGLEANDSYSFKFKEGKEVENEDSN